MQHRDLRTPLRVAAVLGVLALAGCGGGGSQTTTTAAGPATLATTTTATANPQTVATLSRIFAKAQGRAVDAMYQCLFDELAQHIPYKQALEDCKTKLLKTGLAEFGQTEFDPVKDILGGHGSVDAFDPESIVADCSSGNPNVAGDFGRDTYSTGAGVGTHEWGQYSWGNGEGFKGMSRTDSLSAKQAAAEAALTAEAVEDALIDAEDKLVAELAKNAARNAAALLLAAHAAVQAAGKNTVKAQDKALADPNKDNSPGTATTPGGTTPGGTTSGGGTTPGGTTAGGGTTSGGGTTPTPTTPGATTTGSPQENGRSSECEQALADAREFLYECNRTGWKTAACQELNARMNHCPSPSQILVDPDQGYVCGDTVDVLALGIAALERCQRLERGVNGQDPCALPVPDGTYRTIPKEDFDPCTDPAARVDPESGACAGTLQLPNTELDFGKIIVFGLSHFGGPIIVLPEEPKPEGGTRGPDPRPGPPT